MPSHNCIIITMFSFQGAVWILKIQWNLNFRWDFSQPLLFFLEMVGQGLAFLRESHGGCNSPPDCCQEPPFESTLAINLFELGRLGLYPYLTLYWKWWAKVDSNHRPHDYQSCALASWAIGPSLWLLHFFLGTWWRLAGSNRWPPACKAGALPAELNPRIHFSVPSKLNNVILLYNTLYWP